MNFKVFGTLLLLALTGCATGGCDNPMNEWVCSATYVPGGDNSDSDWQARLAKRLAREAAKQDKTQ